MTIEKFWYIGTPYAKYPGGLEEAFKMAATQAAMLLDAGIKVFSPIAHSHPLAERMTGASAVDHDFWISLDECFMAHACGLIVVQAEGWTYSRGLAHEIGYFRALRRPVVYMVPNKPPTDWELQNALRG